MPATASSPLDAPPLQWGVIGAGWIADIFARSVLGHTRSTVQAIGSRDAGRGAAYAQRFDVPTVHSGEDAYERLVADPNVDAVYVATPHALHRDHALLAIGAGKPVLVEKAFTRNAAEAREVLDAAPDVFVMEAVWTRFLPHMVEARRLVADGAVGRVVHVAADFGGSPAYDPQHRNFNPELAGGALLDLGVYPVNFVHDILGAPDAVRAVGTLAPTGVDMGETVLMDYPASGAQGVALATFEADTARTASITGTEGRIDIAAEYYRPTSLTLTRGGRAERVWSADAPLGWQFQVAEVARRVADGATESPVMPRAATLEVMEVLDEVRRQLGVVYPGE
ncbi:Gfo/Idh/MocA family protein [Demequina sp. NBRC 110056]|uniref:Gfo/Idh/MocA family protein n=1 Tax=Demequina sp. NBRC 110056 TaxID=1570345 RepID=UPI00117C0C50|nr:Gfo/Idh/MocA family oxidoreductase [Demequina sp. NBRC 110056]